MKLKQLINVPKAEGSSRWRKKNSF